MKKRARSYRSAITTTLALCTFGTMPSLAQEASNFTGSILIPDDENLSDQAEFERNVGLATVSLPDAVEAAQNSLGSTASPSEVELDDDSGYLAWEVTLGGQEVLIDAGTAEVLTTRPGDMDEDPAQAQVSLSDAVTAAQAALSLDVFPSSVSLDDEDGRLVWEVEFGDQEADVDAATGEVLTTFTDQ